MKRKTTIADLAECAGVSIGTVTRALGGKDRISEETRQRVLAVAKELNYTPNRIARRLAHGNTKIALVCEKGIPEFYDDLIRGANQAFEDLKDYYVEGRIVRVDKNDADMFRKQMKSLAEDGFNGIVISPGSESEAYSKELESSLAPGIWLATVVSDLKHTRRVFCVRQDAVTAGRMAAELLYRMLGPDANIAIFTRKYDSFIHHKTIEGFKQMTEVFPLNVIGVFENFDDAQRAYDTTDRLLRMQPDIGGIYINSANSTTVCRRVEELGMAGRVKIIASDLFEGLEEYIRRDVIQATLFQDPFTQARKCITRLYRAMVEGAQYEEEGLIQPQIIMQSNLRNFAKYIHAAHDEPSPPEDIP